MRLQKTRRNARSRKQLCLAVGKSRGGEIVEANFHPRSPRAEFCNCRSLVERARRARRFGSKCQIACSRTLLEFRFDAVARSHTYIFTTMALVHCYECGKEISSLATACPSCGAPPPPSIAPPSPPMLARPASQAKKFLLGILTVLTGAALVWAIRALVHPPNTPSVAASPTPATAESRSSPPIEMALQRSGNPVATATPTLESATTSSPPVETAAQSSPSAAPTETPTAESATTSSPPVETASQSSPSPSAAETPSVSDASVTTAPPARATY